MKTLIAIFSMVIFANSCFADSASDAIDALLKMQINVKTGISYKDYAPELSKLKFAVKKYILSKNTNKQLTECLSESTRLFDDALTIWNLKFTNDSYYGFIQTNNDYFPGSKALSQAYLRDYPQDAKSVDDGGVMNKEKDRIYIDAAVSKTWERASEKADKCFGLASK